MFGIPDAGAAARGRENVLPVQRRVNLAVPAIWGLKPVPAPIAASGELGTEQNVSSMVALAEMVAAIV